MQQKDDKNKPNQPDGEQPESPPKSFFGSPLFIILSVGFLVLLIIYWTTKPDDGTTINYGLFYRQLTEKNVESVTVVPGEGKITGTFKSEIEDPNDKSEKEEKEKINKFTVYLPGPGNITEDKELHELLKANLGDEYGAEAVVDGTGTLMMFYLFGTIAFLVVMWIMFRRARDQFMGGGGMLSSFNKSPAKKYEAGKERITFKDVAGLDNVKNDLQEIVDFLKNPEKFQRLGGRVPKGVLLDGPPGTGKTLLARAVAGEAEVPFFSISGSEFIQMFVGVGASRVRDLFKIAKESAPSILFIDEIDAVGRVRGAGLGGGHDEREQTLNQILSEMDGFTQTESVIVLAATNRPDVLDPALLRPGRFDRHVTVGRPTRKGRKEIFLVHTREIPLANDVDLDRIAAGTIGLTGADIQNLVNEATLWATRHDKSKVEMDDFEYARDKILMGAAREEMLSETEKTMTAYHEAGHALLAWIIPGADQVHKVTIIPRGRALGLTQLLPEEDKLSISESELRAKLTFIMGGRAAEKLIYDEYSAGAENDLDQATKIARRMVTHWGMSERIGPVALRTSEEHPFLGKEIHEQREHSEQTARIIDEEVSHILHKAAEEAKKLLSENRDKLEKITKALVENEEIDDKDIEHLIGPSANQLQKNNGHPKKKTITTEKSK